MSPLIWIGCRSERMPTTTIKERKESAGYSADLQLNDLIETAGAINEAAFKFLRMLPLFQLRIDLTSIHEWCLGPT